MSDVYKITVTTHTGFAGCIHEEGFEVDKDYSDSLTEDEQELECRDIAFNQIDWDYQVKEIE